MRLVTDIDRGDNAILVGPRKRPTTAQRRPASSPANDAKPRRRAAARLDE
jgi:hypothetical protein